MLPGPRIDTSPAAVPVRTEKELHMYTGLILEMELYTYILLSKRGRRSRFQLNPIGFLP